MPLNRGVGEDSWESLGLQGDPSVHPKGNQSWMFIGRTDAGAEAPIFWPPDVKNWLILKDCDLGIDWRSEEKGMTEDEVVGWHHRPNGHEFEQVPGIGVAQGSLACCSLWGCKESGMTEQLNWSERCQIPGRGENEGVPGMRVRITKCKHFLITQLFWAMENEMSSWQSGDQKNP